MSLSDVAIKRPVFTSMMSLCLIVLGVLGLKRLGTDLFPDVTFPVVMVTTIYKGAGPGEIETQVTKPLEDAVSGISGIDKVHSWSRENASTIAVQAKVWNRDPWGPWDIFNRSSERFTVAVTVK